MLGKSITKRDTKNGYIIEGLTCRQDAGGLQNNNPQPCSIQEFDAGGARKVPECILTLLGSGLSTMRLECPSQVDLK